MEHKGHSGDEDVRRRRCAPFVGIAALLASVALGAGAAHAHATIQPREAAAGSYVQAAVTITHGCDGSATAVVRVKLPEGMISAKPQMKPGWTIEIRDPKARSAAARPARQDHQ